jgi:DNA-binding transcriptional ArsR family regulator
MENATQTSTVSRALASLGHDARLTLFRLLVRSGPDGLSVGQIQDHLDLPASTLAHHLRALVQADLVIQHRKGRTILNRPNFDAMTAMLAFLTAECCSGPPPPARMQPASGVPGTFLTALVEQ